MDQLLAQLRACADPSRLRLLALCGRGAFCVVELADILGQSQPRLSRQLKLLVDAGLLECSRERAHAWFSLTPGTAAQSILSRLDAGDERLLGDARAAARVLAERARVASDSFRRQGADWDEMRALRLPAAQVEQTLLALIDARLGDVLDLGTGTGRLLELLAPRAASCLGIDASPAMLALARSRLARTELSHCRVRLGDAYRLPLGNASVDLVVAQMLLHHTEDPPAILTEARRVLRPGGMMVVIDLEAASGAALESLRWPGFDNADMRTMLRGAGLLPRAGVAIPGPLIVRLWPARLAPMPVPVAPSLEFSA